MKAAGFDENRLDQIHQVLALILLLGNIDFDTDSRGRGDRYMTLDVMGPLAECAKLLQCEPSDVGHGLASTVMVTRGDTIIKENSQQDALDARDAMAKALYGRLFSWVVNQVNNLLGETFVDNVSKTIGVLDIFGFESLEVNSLEQLCINVANEQLQEFFNSHVFAWQLKVGMRGGSTGCVSMWQECWAVLTCS